MINNSIGNNSYIINAELDVYSTANAVKTFACDIGFNVSTATLISTAVSELAMNMLKYAKGGYVVFSEIRTKDKAGIEIICEDMGPGIKDIEKALSSGFSTGHTLGLGLPSAKRIMDEFLIDSHEDRGTKIVIRKWKLK